MHVRRRAIAFAASAWLVLGGILALRHEADVTHATNRLGALVHAIHAIGHRGGAADHLHARAGGDGAECSLDAALRQPGVTIAAPALVAAPAAPCSIDAPLALVADRTAALYRLAPKTSPPRA